MIAGVGNWVGDDAVLIALQGEALNLFSYERAVRSREASLNWVNDASALTELAILHDNQAILADRGAVAQFGRSSEFSALALDSLQRSLALNPVQPTSWLILAELYLQDNDNISAVRAFTWSLDTAYIRVPLSARRLEIAYRLWDDLDRRTRHRLSPAIIDLADRQPAVLAEIAINAGMLDHIMDLLDGEKSDSALLKARFHRVVANYLGFGSPLLSRIGDKAAMQRLLVSASLLLGVALPLPTFAMTIEDYLVINRDAQTSEEEAEVLQYLAGVLDGVLMTAELARVQGTPTLCMTDQQFSALEVGELKVALDLMLENFEREMPNFDELAQTRSIGVASLQLLAYLYPCEDTSLAN